MSEVDQAMRAYAASLFTAEASLPLPTQAPEPSETDAQTPTREQMRDFARALFSRD